jgi:membrane-associated phospholipid phosphatase
MSRRPKKQATRGRAARAPYRDGCAGNIFEARFGFFFARAARKFFQTMRQTISRDFLLWLLAGAVATALAWPLDNRVDAALDASRNPSLHQFAWWCSKLGEGWVPAMAGILLGFLFVLLDQPSVAAKIFFVMLTCELTGLAGLILRLLFGRTRPLAHAPQGFYGVWHDGHWLAGKYEFSSFPSGHSATVVGLAAAAWLVHRGWGVLAAVYALAVMWSRIALQAHHLSDVVASTAVAIPLALLSKQVLFTSVEFQAGNLHRALRKNKTSLKR